MVTCSAKCRGKLIIYSQISTVQPLKFGHGDVISSKTIILTVQIEALLRTDQLLWAQKRGKAVLSSGHFLRERRFARPHISCLCWIMLCLPCLSINRGVSQGRHKVRCKVIQKQCTLGLSYHWASWLFCWSSKVVRSSQHCKKGAL